MTSNIRKPAPGNSGPDSFREDTQRRWRGWIGVDLDGTLAESVKSQAGEDIGIPVHRMVKQVKKWLARGEDVRIFTARVNPYPTEARRSALGRPLKHGRNGTLGRFYRLLTRKIGTWFCCSTIALVKLSAIPENLWAIFQRRIGSCIGSASSLLLFGRLLTLP